MRAAAVVVNFNGGDDLPRCLAALAAQTPPVEVVLVDCVSTDGSDWLVRHPPAGVCGVPLKVNLGFAGGCNAGLEAVGEGVDVVGFFNPDCFPRTDFFAACTARLAREPALGGVAGRLLRADGEHLDSCGQTLTPLLLRVRDRGFGEPAAGAYSEPAAVLAACGAAMVFRRAALAAVAVDGEVFPSDYFAFWEDLEIGWRLTNAGWGVIYEPNAVAMHRRAATAQAGRGRIIFRRAPELQACILANRWATFARHLHRVDFLLRLPVLLLADAAMVTVVIARRPRVLPALLTALPRVRRALRARRTLPRRRLADLP